MNKAWGKPEVCEALATLYLRLNGYFTTGLITHSDVWGNNRSETDCLAVRHPRHSQPDREVPSSPFLDLDDVSTDLIICETKSYWAGLKFNDRVRDDPEVFRALLRWSGLFDEPSVCSLADRLKPLLERDVDEPQSRRGVVESGIRVRLLLCCPPASDTEVQGHWWLGESEMFSYIHRCLNPRERRDTCSTRYPLGLWGYALAPLVHYFKSVQPEDRPSLQQLYRYLAVA